LQEKEKGLKGREKLAGVYRSRIPTHATTREKSKARVKGKLLGATYKKVEGE